MAKASAGVSLQSWDDVNNSLREIAECEIAVTEIEANMNIAMADAKINAERLAKPMQDKIEELKALVEAFTKKNKSDIDGKSKRLTFGVVGFRQRSRVVVPTERGKLQAFINNLRKFDMGNCVVVKETVDKEALEKYPDTDIKKVGSVRKTTNKFFMETDKEKIRR